MLVDRARSQTNGGGEREEVGEGEGGREGGEKEGVCPGTTLWSAIHRGRLDCAAREDERDGREATRGGGTSQHQPVPLSFPSLTGGEEKNREEIRARGENGDGRERAEHFEQR